MAIAFAVSLKKTRVNKSALNILKCEKLKGKFVKMNILFVCTGNTCRSPMAEGLFKKIVHSHDDEEEELLSIASGGMNAAEGMSANQKAIDALLDYNVDISSHKAKNVDAQTIADADLILAITEAHKEMLLYFFGGAAEEKTYTLLEYIGSHGDIDDPYGQSETVYKQCAKKIYDALLKADKIIRSELDV